ncbi:MAG TPA: fluoride efflux transporter CrcB [Thermosynechococcaceae cyanobacterium]
MLLSTSLIKVLAVAIGAIPGALIRFYLTEWCRRASGTGFPYGTFLINITGCGAMGFFVGFTTRVLLPPELSLLIATGFLGSYTTFSTYELDALTLARRGKVGASLFYWAGSVVLGGLALQLGDRLAQL